MSQVSIASRSGGDIHGRIVPGTVTQVELIARRMRRIRIEGDAVSELTWIPGQHVRMHVGDMHDPRSLLHPRGMLRSYSVWDYDGGIELCVLDHDGASGRGPGAQWAREVRPGQQVTFNLPEGSFGLRDARYHVFAGDETASVAFGAMLSVLPWAATAFGVIEVDEPGDRLPLDRDVVWQYRYGAPAASSRTLVDGLAKLDLPDEPGRAYLAGEARTIRMLRDHLVKERGWPRQAISTKPFWTPGKRGLD